MKIGNYTDDEILEFMTEGEGRGFLGRSMFDAMYFEIERLNNIIKEAKEEIEYFELQAKHLDDNIYLDEKLTNKLLDILDKGKE